MPTCVFAIQDTAYYQVTLTAAVSGSSANFSGGSVTAASDTLTAGTPVYVTAGQYAVNFTASATAATGVVSLQMTAADGVTSLTYANATQILDTCADASDESISGDMIVIGAGDADGDITITYQMS